MSTILAKYDNLSSELATLKNAFNTQKRKLKVMKELLQKTMNLNSQLNAELGQAWDKIKEQAEEKAELYDFQDKLEQEKFRGDMWHPRECIWINRGGVKSKLYKSREKLKDVCMHQLFPNYSVAVSSKEGGHIFINENLTSSRRKVLMKANQMCKDRPLVTSWTLDGKTYIETSPDAWNFPLAWAFQLLVVGATFRQVVW